MARTRSRVPSAPYSPELLMMEMIAQTGGLLLGAEGNFEEDIVFAKIEQANFEGPFRAGDAIEIEATSDSLKPEGAWFEGKIRRNDKVVAEARFLLMNVGHLVSGETKSITFHDAFMNHFSVRDKVK